jgi:phosphatidylinositol alpha-mannosyltransferase
MTEAPIIATFHRSGFAEEYESLRPLVRWGSSNIDLRCAVSREAATTAHEALGGEYEIVFNGIEAERFSEAEPWATTGPTLLFIGRHEPRKGLEVLLRALPDLPADLRVWVAGLGPQTVELKSKYTDSRIEWLGSISDYELARRLRAADVLCAPSLGGESFGIVLLEGMAAETVVVASDIPGYHNAARANIDALFVEPDNPIALAAGVRRVLDDDTLRAQLIAGGRERAQAFSMRALAERYLELYELVGSGAAPLASLRRPSDPFGRGLRWVGWRRGAVRPGTTLRP